MKKLLLLTLVLLMMIVHQDLWNWSRAEPLLFGFLPIGLTYHAGYTVACAALMAILVKTAWPTELERDQTLAPNDIADDPDRH